MVIAIQGDWGTGKTSIINFLIKEIDEKNNSTPKSIYFNTWQYSQFKMDNSLYFSFLTNILKRLNHDSSKEKNENTERILNTIFSIGKSIIPGADAIDPAAITKFLRKQEEYAESISNLKEEFQKAVGDYLKFRKNCDDKDRLIIFIDDLDRLNPSIAIELLEVIKLFMDVPKCVFVLAIDYEVVVKGVKQKFGNDVSLEKCRNYFDKMIQLPFRMPVESYDMNDMMKEYLGNTIIENHISKLAEFAQITVGANPRAFKRLVNSFLLIQSIKQNNDTYKDKTNEISMLFCALCIQISYPEIYTYLATQTEWIEQNENSFFDDKLELIKPAIDLKNEIYQYIVNEIKDDRYWNNVSEVLDTLGSVLKFVYKEESKEKSEKERAKLVLGKFHDTLGLTSITSTTTNLGTNEDETKRKTAIKINKINIFNEEINVRDATDAIVKTFNIILNKILEKNSDILKEALEKITMVTNDGSVKNSVFRKTYEINVGEEKIYLGTSTAFSDKCRYTNMLARICKFEKGVIQWYNGKELEYENS